jgi:hypothetical protein
VYLKPNLPSLKPVCDNHKVLRANSRPRLFVRRFLLVLAHGPVSPAPGSEHLGRQDGPINGGKLPSCHL